MKIIIEFEVDNAEAVSNALIYIKGVSSVKAEKEVTELGEMERIKKLWSDLDCNSTDGRRNMWDMQKRDIEKRVEKKEKMSELKTLKEIIAEQSGGTHCYPMIKDGEIPNTDDKVYLDALRTIEKRLIEEAKKWIKALNETLEKACKKQTDGYYNDGELEIDGLTYTACAFGDDETQPIIKFIKQFFNLEEKNKK